MLFSLGIFKHEAKDSLAKKHFSIRTDKSTREKQSKEDKVKKSEMNEIFFLSDLKLFF